MDSEQKAGSKQTKKPQINLHAEPRAKPHQHLIDINKGYEIYH